MTLEEEIEKILGTKYFKLDEKRRIDFEREIDETDKVINKIDEKMGNEIKEKILSIFHYISN